MAELANINNRIVLVEGNICAGKSTLSQKLAEELGLKLFLEPVQHNPFLELYYGDPKKYALVMQIWLLKQRYRTYVNAIKFLMCNSDCRGVILDRSIYSDGTFAEQNFVDGNFTRRAYDYYKALKKQMMAHLPPPSLVLYLDVSAEKCHERIHGLRQRECENGIPLPYLQGLEQCHHNMIRSMEEEGIKVLSLNWKEFGTDESMQLITREIAQSTQVPQSAQLKSFIFDDGRVVAQADFSEQQKTGDNSHSSNTDMSVLMQEHLAVEKLMVATIDPSDLTEGEVAQVKEQLVGGPAHGHNDGGSNSKASVDSISSSSSLQQGKVAPLPPGSISIASDAPTTPRKAGKYEEDASSPVSVNDIKAFDLPIASAGQ